MIDTAENWAHLCWCALSRYHDRRGVPEVLKESRRQRYPEVEVHLRQGVRFVLVRKNDSVVLALGSKKEHLLRAQRAMEDNPGELTAVQRNHGQHERKAQWPMDLTG